MNVRSRLITTDKLPVGLFVKVAAKTRQAKIAVLSVGASICRSSYQSVAVVLLNLVLMCDDVRSLKPDFVLIRQHGRDAQNDWRNVIIGLQFGAVPSINPLPAAFCFLDKPFVVSIYRYFIITIS